MLVRIPDEPHEIRGAQVREALVADDATSMRPELGCLFDEFAPVFVDHARTVGHILPARDSLVRLSVGIEAVEDITQDLEQALEAI